MTAPPEAPGHSSATQLPRPPSASALSIAHLPEASWIPRGIRGKTVEFIEYSSNLNGAHGMGLLIFQSRNKKGEIVRKLWDKENNYSKWI
jgi:hypothetical protein